MSLVPCGAMLVVRADVQRRGYFSSKGVNAWLLLSSAELRKALVCEAELAGMDLSSVPPRRRRHG